MNSANDRPVKAALRTVGLLPPCRTSADALIGDPGRRALSEARLTARDCNVYHPGPSPSCSAYLSPALESHLPASATGVLWPQCGRCYFDRIAFVFGAVRIFLTAHFGRRFTWTGDATRSIVTAGPSGTAQRSHECRHPARLP